MKTARHTNLPYHNCQPAVWLSDSIDVSLGLACLVKPPTLLAGRQAGGSNYAAAVTTCYHMLLDDI